MSALTDLFTAMANKIRSKTGTATTYTPTEMASDGIDDVYDAGVASVPTPTSITPSNANPVTLTANTAVKPTANGYAISSYNNVTPSNSTPVALASGDIDKMGGNGYAIASYNSLSPSNVDPVQLTGNTIYKVTSGVSGYAIRSYSAKLPSDSNPPSVASGDIVLMGGAGYLVSSNPNDNVPTLIGTQTVASTSNVTMTLTESISNYRYIYVTGSGNFNGNYDSTDSKFAKCLIKVSYLKNNTVTCYFLSGQDGSMTQRTVTVTYSTDTKLIFKANNSVSRAIGVYGIK